MKRGLFKGKRVDTKEWVEGFYVCLGGKYHYILSGKLDLTKGYPDLIKYEVIPESIGECSFVPDKNGQLIFEGDIVDVEYDVGYVGVAKERIGVFEVVFDNGCFMKKNNRGLFHFISSDVCTVVGNVSDNRSLLD